VGSRLIDIMDEVSDRIILWWFIKVKAPQPLNDLNEFIELK